MFDFDAGKFIIIGIVALVVIGPKELPRVMRQVGQAAAKMRRMAAEFRGQFMDAMREAGIDDIKADVAKLAESAKADAGIDPLAQVKAELTQALDAAGKPATLPVVGASTATPPRNAEPSALLGSPETPEEGAEAGAATPGQLPPAARAVDAEM
ncbi:MAG: twin-arginine translocase TatA/TatE family subunit, partial [Methylocella sp.]